MRTYAYLLTDLLLDQGSDELLRDVSAVRAGEEVRKRQLGKDLLQLRIAPATVSVYVGIYCPAIAYLAMMSASL